jgi:hypothetical protein
VNDTPSEEVMMPAVPQEEVGFKLALAGEQRLLFITTAAPALEVMMPAMPSDEVGCKLAPADAQDLQTTQAQQQQQQTGLRQV